MFRDTIPQPFAQAYNLYKPWFLHVRSLNLRLWVTVLVSSPKRAVKLQQALLCLKEQLGNKIEIRNRIMKHHIYRYHIDMIDSDRCQAVDNHIQTQCTQTDEAQFRNSCRGTSANSSSEYIIGLS